MGIDCCIMRAIESRADSSLCFQIALAVPGQDVSHINGTYDQPTHKSFVSESVYSVHIVELVQLSNLF